MDSRLKKEIEAMDERIRSFIMCSYEDGGITVAGLRGLAGSMGVINPELINNEIELIRKIQKASHQRACFRSGNQRFCEEHECQWKTECRKIIAEWIR